ncbi:uncharacterized protein J3D65DRAFT_61943 [Phyllosticta citribraziliensis]|uniref:BZIP domain-containing protein n=1 Tax=Phyllosticta citribraziliensis TaxID=989973 RepID=A0ABR1LE66_9PEZI
MARKKSAIPPSIRQRDNQRRSRAQQKEHVAQLQAKLLAYEQHGVQATAAVQQAARAVAHENRLLRELLAQRGVSRYEVDRFLGEQRSVGIEEMVGCGGGVTSMTRATSYTSTITDAFAGAQTSIPQSPLNTVEPAAAAAATTQPHLPHAYDHQTIHTSTLHGSDTASGQEMSCAEAAAIMAAMRGQHHSNDSSSYEDDLELARRELGCAADALLMSCRIRNVRLMDVLDRGS